MRPRFVSPMGSIMSGPNRIVQRIVDIAKVVIFKLYYLSFILIIEIHRRTYKCTTECTVKLIQFYIYCSISFQVVKVKSFSNEYEVLVSKFHDTHYISHTVINMKAEQIYHLMLCLFSLNTILLILLQQQVHIFDIMYNKIVKQAKMLIHIPPLQIRENEKCKLHVCMMEKRFREQM